MVEVGCVAEIPTMPEGGELQEDRNLKAQATPTETLSQVAGQRCASEQQSRGAEGKAAPPGTGLTPGWSCLRCPHVILPAGMEQVSKC